MDKPKTNKSIYVGENSVEEAGTENRLLGMSLT